MINIDGSIGGGQIIRTATALSTVTCKSVSIINIRSSRPNPGLRAQHIASIKALAELCSANVKGMGIGSKKIIFRPKIIQEKEINIKIPTAGSIGLILQALMLSNINLNNKLKITITGGATWNKWAPPVIYFKRVLFPLIKDKTEINIKKEGFYPKGGARVNIISKPLKIKNINITETNNIKEINGVSLCSKHLEKKRIAERQRNSVLNINKAKINTSIVDSLSPGSGILLWVKTNNSIFGSDCVGEMGKKAEDIGKSAITKLIYDLKNGAVDRHAADMLIPYMGLKGRGKIKAPIISNHIISNISVVEEFLQVKFKINKKMRIIEVKKN